VSPAVQVEALVFSAPHSCEVAAYDLPTDLGPGEVLIRNRLGLISPGTELAMFCRSHPGFEVEGHWARYPYYPGYCNVGVVEAVGARVEGLEPGARVVHQASHSTATRQPASMVIPVGTLADERAVFLKLLGVALTPQLLAPVRFGEGALVLGLGLVGNLAAQLCREAGAYPVVAVDRAEARVAWARACGLDARDADGSVRAAYVIEAVGLAAALRAALDAVLPDGRVVILSSPRERIEIDPYFDIHHRGVQIVGAHEWRRDRAQRALYDAFLEHLLATEQVQVDPLVSHRVPFHEAQRAYEGLRDDPGTWLGVLLEYPDP
jgi:2-desacetyl-2-hydroxyethyl bacteriochlorophyllide A dehydrogenase